METDDLILLKILKGIKTITELANELNLSRPGIWKALKKLEKDNLIILNQITKTKTSIKIITLNWKNPLTEKLLETLLIKEANQYQRWLDTFIDIKEISYFVILFGSILINEKRANDIDLLIVSDNLKEINQKLEKIQKTQIKKIHSTNLTKDEFKKELNTNIFKDIIKKGIILYGQNNFINLLK